MVSSSAFKPVMYACMYSATAVAVGMGICHSHHVFMVWRRLLLLDVDIFSCFPCPGLLGIGLG
jgi:hypothetical protein